MLSLGSDLVLPYQEHGSFIMVSIHLILFFISIFYDLIDLLIPCPNLGYSTFILIYLLYQLYSNSPILTLSY